MCRLVVRVAWINERSRRDVGRRDDQIFSALDLPHHDLLAGIAAVFGEFDAAVEGLKVGFAQSLAYFLCVQRLRPLERVGPYINGCAGLRSLIRHYFVFGISSSDLLV